MSFSSSILPANQSAEGCPKIVLPTANPFTKGAFADALNTFSKTASGASKPRIKIPRQCLSFFSMT